MDAEELQYYKYCRMKQINEHTRPGKILRGTLPQVNESGLSDSLDNSKEEV